MQASKVLHGWTETSQIGGEVKFLVVSLAEFDVGPKWRINHHVHRLVGAVVTLETSTSYDVERKAEEEWN
jgi:hypothetical protein